MLNENNIAALMMRRQHLIIKADEDQYINLYRDTSPGQNVYFHGFGEPPTLCYRTEFNDIEFNRIRQLNRKLIKGRFQGGNLGWIEREDIELFAGLSQTPLNNPAPAKTEIVQLIEREGPMNIQIMKEFTGMLVKEITPELHKLQRAFLIFEDQYDGEWDRGWYMFSEAFPDVDINRYTRKEALKIILKRFAYRLVFFDLKMAQSFYKVPLKQIKAAADELVEEKIFSRNEDGYISKADFSLLNEKNFTMTDSIYIMHRSDFLVKANEKWLKVKYKSSDSKVLYYILVNGKFQGAVMGHFKYGPYIIEDVLMDIPEIQAIRMKDDIIKAISSLVNLKNNPIKRFMGIELV